METGLAVCGHPRERAGRGSGRCVRGGGGAWGGDDAADTRREEGQGEGPPPLLP